MKGIDNKAMNVELKGVVAFEDILTNGKGFDKVPETTSNTDNATEDITIEAEAGKLYTYDVYENPNILLTIGFAMQQVLMSLSRSLSTSLLVADIVCARTDENYKAKLLSTTMFISGLTTLLQNTIGIRLPLYQGPSATYVIPLLAMSSLKDWKCPDFTSVTSTVANTTDNTTLDITSLIMERTQKLEGSLMIAGAFHMLVGLTGIVGVFLRFIGPVTIVPALTIVALFIYKATTKFAKTQWGVALLTVAVSMIMSFYLRNCQTPIPAWSRDRGFYIKWFPAHKMFSVLLACAAGWIVSAILTSCNVLSDDPKSNAYYARTDSRLEVIDQTDWFIFPYPGQFGPPGVDAGALMAFFMGTISSVIDSIGDYYACAKMCTCPPPPNHAVNRGIAVEGFMSFLGGWSGAGHATSTFGGNIGAIGITRVASLRVFQVVGVIFIVFGVVGKIGAVFVTIPYSVVGGMMMINFGVLIGVMLSNLQFIDMNSTRNLAIIGMSMLIALMTPHWINTTPNAIDTGVEKLDNVLTMFLANPVFVAGILSCFMDNTIPGSLEERGMLAWKADLTASSDEEQADKVTLGYDTERREKLLKVIYNLPFADRLLRKFPKLKYIPIYPR